MATHSISPQVQIRFITKQLQYAVPDAPFAVPSSVTVVELNSLVNELIGEGQISKHKHVEFEFLINGELLRVSLREHLEHQEISSETVIEVEYLERLPAPEPQDCLLHDDWVAAVQVAPTGTHILTGCYDNSLQLWTSKGSHVTSVSGHGGPVKAVAWVTLDDDEGLFLSGSLDQTAMLWRWQTDGSEVNCITVFKGHERNIESLSVSPNKTWFASGGWDTLLKVWKVQDEDWRGADGETTAKRPKRGSDITTKTPYMTVKGHRDCISCVTWMDDTTPLSAGWDHTLKLWDSEVGGLKQEIAGNKAFFHVDHSSLSGTILTASADKHIRLYDPRSTEGAVVKTVFTSHTQWVQSVMWSRTRDHLFMSGAYDNMVKLWDTRSPKAPLFDLGGHKDKVLCCDWSWEKIMVSGGADNTMRIFKSKHSICDT